MRLSLTVENSLRIKSSTSMINHVQTLLLNESASVVQATLSETEYGYIDPIFTQVKVDGSIDGIYKELFSGSTVLADKMRLVKLLLPYFHDPEFADTLSAFDQRVATREKVPTSIFDFYTSSRENPGPLSISHLLASANAPAAFLPSGDELLDRLLPRLQNVYSTSKEDVRRFSALLFAIVVHLEASRLRSLS